MQMADESAINKSYIKINPSVALEAGICMMRGIYRQSKHQTKHSSIALLMQKLSCKCGVLAEGQAANSSAYYIYAKSDRRCMGFDTLITTSIASDRGGNEEL